MKKILVAFVLCAMAFSAYPQSRPNLKDVARLSYYKERNKSIEPGMVIFAGNSITEGWPKASPDFFTGNKFLGRGISGQTTQGLLLRFRQDVLDLKPAVVVINMGTNDIAENNGPYEHQLTFDCIKSMAELADYHGIKVILSSVLPVKEYRWNPSLTDVPGKISALNAAIKAFADENGFAYIDYYTPMAEADGALKAAYGRDGVHPVKEGYNVMEQEALKVINDVKGQKAKKVKKAKKEKDRSNRGMVVGFGVGL